MTETQERAWMKALGTEIKVWRQRRGMTRDELAAKSGVSVSTLGRIERAETMPSINDTRLLADALKLRLSALLERVESVVDLVEPTIEPEAEAFDPRQQ